MFSRRQPPADMTASGGWLRDNITPLTALSEPENAIMSLTLVRQTCLSCRETLPRAAVIRCPFCRAPIPALDDVALRIICRRCNKKIPRAPAGKCPSCAAEDLRRQEAIFGRRVVQ